jgi:hypothetical protein
MILIPVLRRANMVNRLVVLMVLSLAGLSLAQAPLLLGYQGRLMKTDGTPESGNVQMRFAFFGGETGGTSVWEETQAVSLAQGFYSTYLGRSTAFPATVFDTSTVWLEVAVQAPGDTQFRTLTPRQRVASVAYAISARSVKGGTVDATTVSVNGTEVIDATGKLTASAGYTAGSGISINPTTRAISLISGCATGQVLQWGGSTWQCATATGGGGGGGISGVTGTAPIVVTNGTTTPTVSVSVGTTAGTVAAGNDSRFGNATTLAGRAIAQTAPSSGQVLSFDGTQWLPTTPAGGTPTAATRTDLSAWFELNEMTGASFVDSTGNGNTAVSTTGGGIAPGSTSQFGRGVAFSSGSLTVANPVLPASPTVSVEAWIQPQAPIAGVDTIVARVGMWALKTNGAEASFEVLATNPTSLCKATTNGAGLSAGTWYQLVGSYDGRHVSIRVNGSLVVSQACANGPVARPTAAALHIGGLGSPTVTESFNGIIDDVLIRTFPVVAPSKYVSEWRSVSNTGMAVSFNHNLGTTPSECKAYWSTSATGVPKRLVGEFQLDCYAGPTPPYWRGLELQLDANTVSFVTYAAGYVFCYYDPRVSWQGTNTAFVQVVCTL